MASRVSSSLEVRIVHIFAMSPSSFSLTVALSGSGEFLGQADLVIQMKCYKPLNVTQRARDIVASHPRHVNVPRVPIRASTRCVSHSAAASAVGDKGKPVIRVFEKGTIQVRAVLFAPLCYLLNLLRVVRSILILQYGSGTIDVHALEQVTDQWVARAIGHCVWFIFNKLLSPPANTAPLRELLAELEV